MSKAIRPSTHPLHLSGDQRLVQAVLELGRGRDIEDGGLYDARSGAVNLWCGPQDKPDGWTEEITCGALPHPRELVGTLYWEWREQKDGTEVVVFFVDTCPYVLLRGDRVQRWCEIPDALWAACERWTLEKSVDLVQEAAALIGPKIGESTERFEN